MMFAALMICCSANCEKTVAERYSDLHYYEIDTAYIARDWTPEQGAAFLETLKGEYSDMQSWEKRKNAIDLLRMIIDVKDSIGTQGITFC